MSNIHKIILTLKHEVTAQCPLTHPSTSIHLQPHTHIHTHTHTQGRETDTQAQWAEYFMKAVCETGQTNVGYTDD